MRKTYRLAVVSALLLILVGIIDNRAAAQTAVCPDAPPSFFEGIYRGRVTLTPPGRVPIPVRLRSDPGLNSQVIAELKDGTPFVVEDGPKCVDHLVWWQIRTDDGLRGWVAEGDKSGYFIEPIVSAPTPTPRKAEGNQKRITYQNPLAYIGLDNNVYVTDIHSGAGTQLTTNGEVPSLACGTAGGGDTAAQVYSHIQWSPAGGGRSQAPEHRLRPHRRPLVEPGAVHAARP